MAQSELEKLQQRHQEHPAQWFAALADEYRRQGELDLALETVRQGLLERSNYVSGYVVLARTLIDKGEDQEALEVFQRVLSLDSENVIALKGLWEINERTGDVESAKRWAKLAVDVDPHNEDAKDALERLTAAAGAAAPALAEQAPESPSGVGFEQVAETTGDSSKESTQILEPPAGLVSASSGEVETSAPGDDTFSGAVHALNQLEGLDASSPPPQFDDDGDGSQVAAGLTLEDGLDAGKDEVQPLAGLEPERTFEDEAAVLKSEGEGVEGGVGLDPTTVGAVQLNDMDFGADGGDELPKTPDGIQMGGAEGFGPQDRVLDLSGPSESVQETTAETASSLGDAASPGDLQLDKEPDSDFGLKIGGESSPDSADAGDDPLASPPINDLGIELENADSGVIDLDPSMASGHEFASSDTGGIELDPNAASGMAFDPNAASLEDFLPEIDSGPAGDAQPEDLHGEMPDLETHLAEVTDEDADTSGEIPAGESSDKPVGEFDSPVPPAREIEQDSTVEALEGDSPAVETTEQVITEGSAPQDEKEVTDPAPAAVAPKPPESARPKVLEPEHLGLNPAGDVQEATPPGMSAPAETEAPPQPVEEAVPANVHPEPPPEPTVAEPHAADAPVESPADPPTPAASEPALAEEPPAKAPEAQLPAEDAAPQSDMPTPLTEGPPGSFGPTNTPVSGVPTAQPDMIESPPAEMPEPASIAPEPRESSQGITEPESLGLDSVQQQESVSESEPAAAPPEEASAAAVGQTGGDEGPKPEQLPEPLREPRKTPPPAAFEVGSGFQPPVEAPPAEPTPPEDIPAPAAPAAETAAEQTSGSVEFLDLETPPGGVRVRPATHEEEEHIDDLPVVPESTGDLNVGGLRPARSGNLVDHPPEAEPQPVVTETMAELYVKQGLVREAVDVYRQLVQMNPAEARFHARLQELEVQAASLPPRDDGAPVPFASRETGGQSAKSFLSALLQGSAQVPESKQPLPPPGQPVKPAFLGESAAEAAPPSAPPADLTFIQPESAPPVLPPPEDVPDQLDEEPPLFGEDDLPGKPLRAARDEVSLSSVFGKGKSKVNVAQPGKPGASFDEFFGKTVEEDVNLDDMAQDEETDGAFRAWLRGLKS